MDQLNGNIHYQLSCDVMIDPMRPLTNYKLLDDVISELAHSLKIQQQQYILVSMWKPYMKGTQTRCIRMQHIDSIGETVPS